MRWYTCARRWFPCCNVYSLALLLMVLCLFLLVINIYELRLMQVDHAALHNIPPAIAAADDKNSQRRPVVWVHGKMVNRILGFIDIVSVVILYHFLNCAKMVSMHGNVCKHFV